MSCSQEILISRRQDVRNLLHLDKRIKIIRLRIQTLSEKDNNEYQKKLTHYHNACGCNTGAFLSVLTISIYILTLIIQMRRTGIFSFGWSSVAFLIFLFVVSAAVGKGIGIINAKIKYRKIISDIEEKTKILKEKYHVTLQMY